MDFPIDMVRGTTILRCVADFMAARPSLPALCRIEIMWSHIEEAWRLSGQLDGDDASDIDKWAVSLDDSVLTMRVVASDQDRYTVREVAGTLHGVDMRVWMHLPGIWPDGGA